MPDFYHLLTWALAAGSAALPSTIFLDPASGVIDGKVAVAFLPSLPGSEEPFDPVGVEVHLTPATDLDRELVYPAGVWFQPPPGRYRVWLEGGGRISQGSLILSYSGGPFRGHGLLTHDVVEKAGTVRLSNRVETVANITLRLLHLESHNRGSFPKRELSRRVRGEKLRQGVLMPSGLILAGLFDDQAQEYTALSRPLAVTAGETAEVTPETPRAGSHLVVALDRPEPLSSFADYAEQLSAEIGETVRQPDVLAPTADRLYAVWYGLEGRYARLHLSSPQVFLQEATVPLRSGAVERYHAQLQPLPNLAVATALPPELDREPLAIEVRAGGAAEALHRATLAPATTSTTIARLPAAPLEVTLYVGPWEFREQVDLSDGKAGSVLFAPQPIYLSGSVYRGAVTHPATLRLRPSSGGQVIVVHTNARGGYRAALFRPISLAFVELQGKAGPPFVELLRPPIRESGTRDFRLPGNDYSVLVRDARSGEPVSGAAVEIRNEARSGEISSQDSMTGPDGRAGLQPLRPGQVTVVAEAQDYYPSQPLTRPVSETDETVELMVSLEPIGDAARLSLILPDGSPAAGAGIVARPVLEAEAEIWAATADHRGEVAVPSRVHGAWLLVRHARSGFLVRQWQEPAAGDAAIWRLPLQAPPLKILTVDPAGEPTAWADIAVWVGGIRLAGSALAWLTQTSASSDGRGLWSTDNLPTEPFEVLAWTISGRDTARSGSWDALATPVSFPWPEAIVLEALGDL